VPRIARNNSPAIGRRLLVEVKGWPSTTYASGERAGLPKPTQPTLGLLTAKC